MRQSCIRKIESADKRDEEAALRTCLEGVEQGGINFICSGRQHAHEWHVGSHAVHLHNGVVGQHTALCVSHQGAQQRHMAPAVAQKSVRIKL